MHRSIPAHKQTDPTKAPGQVVNPIPSPPAIVRPWAPDGADRGTVAKVITLGDYIRRAQVIDLYHAAGDRLVAKGGRS